MKKYDLLLSFGCSFTEGGGLNDRRYHDYIMTNFSRGEDVDQYQVDHCYPTYLSKLLNCEVINYGVSCAGNELIFRKVYEECSKYKDGKNILVTVQTSILSRMLLNSADDNEVEYVLNTDHGHSDYISQYYRTYIQRFYNPKKEFKKLIMNVDLLQTWLKSKNFDFVFIAWETISPVPKEYFCSSDIMDGCFSKFAEMNRVLISDLPGIPYVDMHVTEIGNKMIANKIFKYLEEKND